jgi:hypothetical protein
LTRCTGPGSLIPAFLMQRKIGQSQANAEQAKQAVHERIKAQQKAAEQKQKQEKAKNIFGGAPTNTDAVNQIDKMIKNPNELGAYRNAESIRNDPALQAEIKNRGYTANQFIDAMYNAVSKGKFRSEREYNQFAGQLNKDTKAKNKAFETAHGMTKDEWDKLNAPPKQQGKSNNQSLLDKLESFLPKKKNDGPSHNWFYDSQAWLDKHAIQPVENKLERFATNFADSALFGQVKKNLDQHQNDTPDFVKKAAQAPKTKADKTADVLGQLAGMAAPIGGAYKLTKPAAEAGFKLLTRGKDLGQLGRYLESGVRGGTAMASYSTANELVDAALHPNDATFGQRAKDVGINTLYGVVGDPLIKGLGEVASTGLGKLAKGEVPAYTGKPSEDTLSKLDPKQDPVARLQELINAATKQAESKQPSPLPESSKTMDSFKTKDIPTVDIPGVLHENITPKTAKLEDVLKEYGQTDSSPESIANAYNQKQWYHGTGTDNLTKDQLDPFAGNHEGLFGHGIYLTDNPEIANGYAKSRGRKTSTPTIYDAKVNMDRVLDLEKPVPHDAKSALDKFTKPLDYQYNGEFGQDHHFSDIVNEMAQKGATTEEIIQRMRTEVRDFSHEAGISTNEFVQDFQDLAVYLKEHGYDGITHTGGGRTGHDPHRVLIALDPNDGYAQTGRANQVTDFNPNDPAALVNQFKDQKLNSIKGNPDTSSIDEMLKLLSKESKSKAEPYTNISQAPTKKTPGMLPAGELDNHDFGLIDTKSASKSKAEPKPNPYDIPYKPGEDLPDTRSHIGSKTEKSPINIKNKVDKAYIKTVDNLHRLSQFDKQVQHVLERDLKPTESTHLLGLNSRGSDMISKQILTENMVDKTGKVVGKSLKDIMKKVPKRKLNDFEDYLVNKHAITRMERGEKVFPDEMNMTTGKSKEIVKNYEENHPEFKELAKEVYTYNKQLGQKWLVDAGILSKEDWEGYLKANPHYVPNNRIFSDLERSRFANGAKKGFANQSNPVKKAIGSQRKIVSPIESTIEHTAQYVKTAKRNEVMQTLINNINQNPKAFKDWAEIVQTDKTPESIKETLQNEGVDGVLSEFNKGFEQKPDLTKGNIVRGLIDGKPVHVRVHDPELLDALTNLQPKAQNLVIHSIGQVTRVMKNLTTGINPVFSLTRNIFRDIPTAFTNSKSTNNPFVFSKDLVQSVVSVMKNDDLYRSFKAVGGGHASPISSDMNLLAQSKRSILPQKGVKPLLGKGLGALENLNNAVEAAPRLAEFKRFAGDSYDSKMKALYESNDVTVNFNRYGNVAKDVDSDNSLL